MLLPQVASLCAIFLQTSDSSLSSAHIFFCGVPRPTAKIPSGVSLHPVSNPRTRCGSPLKTRCRSHRKHVVKISGKFTRVIIMRLKKNCKNLLWGKGRGGSFQTLLEENMTGSSDTLQIRGPERGEHMYNADRHADRRMHPQLTNDKVPTRARLSGKWRSAQRGAHEIARRPAREGSDTAYAHIVLPQLTLVCNSSAAAAPSTICCTAYLPHCT